MNIMKPIVRIYDPDGIWILNEDQLTMYNVSFPTLHESSVNVDSISIEVIIQHVLTFSHDDDQRTLLHRMKHMYTQPFVNIYVLRCDDVDSYKNRYKLFIDAFINYIKSTTSDGDTTQWLVVYAPPLRPKGTFLSSVAKAHRKVFTSIRSDYGKDRCARLDDESDAEFAREVESVKLKIRNTLLVSYRNRCSAYENALSRVQLSMSTLNQYCWMHEGYVGLHLQMGLTGVALRMYDELCATMDSVCDSSSSSLILDDHSEAPSATLLKGILDLQSSPIVQQQHQQDAMVEADELEWRRYVFSRQIQMLFEAHDYVRVGELAVLFISTFTQAMTRHGVSVVKQASWQILSCLLVGRALWSNGNGQESSLSKLNQLNALLGDLCRVALDGVKRVGVGAGYISFEVPVEEELLLKKQSDERDTANVVHVVTTPPRSHQPLFAIHKSTDNHDTFGVVPSVDTLLAEVSSKLTDEKSCRVLFLEVCNETLHCYTEARRRRIVARLQSLSAYAYYEMGAYDKAVRLFQEGVDRHSREKWPVLAVPSELMVAKCYRRLNMPNEYIRTCLHLLQNAKHWTVPQCRPHDLQRELLAYIENAPVDRVTITMQNLLPIMKVNALLETSEIEIELNNGFPMELVLDSFSMVVCMVPKRRKRVVTNNNKGATGGGIQATFLPTSLHGGGQLHLKPGANTFTMSNQFDLAVDVRAAAASTTPPSYFRRVSLADFENVVDDERSGSSGLVVVDIDDDDDDADDGGASDTDQDNNNDDHDNGVHRAAVSQYQCVIMSLTADIHCVHFEYDTNKWPTDVLNVDKFTMRVISRQHPGIRCVVHQPENMCPLVLGQYQYVPITIFTGYDTIDQAEVTFHGSGGDDSVVVHDGAVHVLVSSCDDSDDKDVDEGKYREEVVQIEQGSLLLYNVPPETRVDFAVPVYAPCVQRKHRQHPPPPQLQQPQQTMMASHNPHQPRVESERRMLVVNLSYTRPIVSKDDTDNDDDGGGICESEKDLKRSSSLKDTLRKSSLFHRSRSLLSELVYEKRAVLSFTQPLWMRSSVQRLQNRWFVQICLQCATEVAVILTSYTLKLPAPFCLIEDPNRKVHLRCIQPGEECYLAFEIKQQQTSESNSQQTSALSRKEDDDDGDAGEEYTVRTRSPSTVSNFSLDSAVFSETVCGLILVDCYCVTSAAIGLSNDNVDIMSLESLSKPLEPTVPKRRLSHLQWPIHVTMHSEDFHITVSFPPHVFIGQRVPFSVRILHVQPSSRPVPKSSSSISDLLYEIYPQQKMWMLSGKQRVRVKLDAGDEACSVCHLVPVVCGYLPLPQIELTERVDGSDLFEPVHPSRILRHFASQQIYVYPPRDFNTGVSPLA